MGAPGSLVYMYLGEFHAEKHRAKSICFLGFFFTLAWLILPGNRSRLNRAFFPLCFPQSDSIPRAGESPLHCPDNCPSRESENENLSADPSMLIRWLARRFGMDHHTVADILRILRHPVQLLADIPRRPQPTDVRHCHDHSHVPRKSQIPGVAGQDRRSARDPAADLRGEYRPRQERVSGKRLILFTLPKCSRIARDAIARFVDHHDNQIRLRACSRFI